MFTDWIAEDVGCSTSAVVRWMDPRPGHSSEWATLWQSIRRNPTMLALHREFMPGSLAVDDEMLALRLAA
jgi:hypothetical protein